MRGHEDPDRHPDVPVGVQGNLEVLDLPLIEHQAGRVGTMGRHQQPDHGVTIGERVDRLGVEVQPSHGVTRGKQHPVGQHAVQAQLVHDAASVCRPSRVRAQVPRSVHRLGHDGVQAGS